MPVFRQKFRSHLFPHALLNHLVNLLTTFRPVRDWICLYNRSLPSWPLGWRRWLQGLERPISWIPMRTWICGWIVPLCYVSVDDPDRVWFPFVSLRKNSLKDHQQTKGRWTDTQLLSRFGEVAHRFTSEPMQRLCALMIWWFLYRRRYVCHV